MAFVHFLSPECLKSELDLFSVLPTQTSIESSNYIDYHPIASLTNDTSPIEFYVGGSGQDYIDLSATQLYVRAEIVRPNGQPIEDASEVGPINLFLHSLFADVEIKLNDVAISNSSSTYPYRAYLETLLSYGTTAKQSQLTSSVYYKDTPGSMEDANPVAQDPPNKGLKARYNLFSPARTVEMLGCIHADLFFQAKYLPSDVGLRLRLIRSKDAFCLMSSQPNTGYKVKIHECKLYIKKVKLSSSVFLAHAQAFETGNAKYPIRRVVCKTFTIPAGNLDFTQENVFAGQLPTRLVMGLVDNDAFNGNYGKNPFNFKHHNLTQLKILIDGQQQHNVKPIEPNFAAHHYLEAYMSQFSGTGKQQKDEGTDISRTDFPRGYAIYAFDLTPDMSEDSHFNLSRDGNLRVELKFSDGLANTVNCIIYSEFEHVVEIDRNKTVIFDFSN
jgi:hypothetical protein